MWFRGIRRVEWSRSRWMFECVSIALIAEGVRFFDAACACQVLGLLPYIPKLYRSSTITSVLGRRVHVSYFHLLELLLFQ